MVKTGGVKRRAHLSLMVAAAVAALAVTASSCAAIRVESVEPVVRAGAIVRDTPVTEAPVNLDFEEVDANGLPVGWSFDLSDARTGSDDEKRVSGERSAWLASLLTRGSGEVSQCVDATPYRGHTFAVSAMLRSSGRSTPNGGYVFARAQDDDGRGYSVRRYRQVAAEDSERLSGRRWWARYGVAIDVPERAHAVCFGFRLIGPSQVHADAFELEAHR